MTLATFVKVGALSKNKVSSFLASSRFELSTSAPVCNHSFKDFTQGFATESEIENYSSEKIFKQKSQKRKSHRAVALSEKASIKKLSNSKAATLFNLKRAVRKFILQVIQCDQIRRFFPTLAKKYNLWPFLWVHLGSIWNLLLQLFMLMGQNILTVVKRQIMNSNLVIWSH